MQTVKRHFSQYHWSHTWLMIILNINKKLQWHYFVSGKFSLCASSSPRIELNLSYTVTSHSPSPVFWYASDYTSDYRDKCHAKAASGDHQAKRWRVLLLARFHDVGLRVWADNPFSLYLTKHLLLLWYLWQGQSYFLFSKGYCMMTPLAAFYEITIFIHL